MRRPVTAFSSSTAFAVALLAWSVGPVLGQGSLQGVTLLTDGSSAIHSVEVAVPGRPSALTSYLEMVIGLGTDEKLVPLVIPDAMTVNVMDFLGQKTVVLVTADIAGFVWRPETPGTIPLGANAVASSLVAFPLLDPTRETSAAYLVRVELPAVFYGQDVKVVVDLFDNLNTLGSTAFLGNVALVPEPGSLLLLGFGGLVLVFRRRS